MEISMSIIELGMDLDQMAEYEALPDGPYKAEIRDVEVRFSEKVPHGYYYMQMLVPVDEFPADYDAGNAPEGLNIIHSRMKVPSVDDRRSVAPFKAFLKAVGISTKGNKFDPQDWVGKQVQVLLKRSEYNGSPVNNVEAIGAIPKV
jgi:hypothetical protein